MTDFSPEARRLFQVARESYSPDDERLAKVGAAIVAQVALSVAVGSTAAAATTKVAGAKAATLLSATKIVGIFAVVGTVGVAASNAPRIRSMFDGAATPAQKVEAVREAPGRGTAPLANRPETPSDPVTGPVAIPVPTAVQSTHRLDKPNALRASNPAASEPILGPTEPTKVVLEETVEDRPSQAPTRAQAAPAVSDIPAPAAQKASDELKAEVDLVRSARAALDSGSPARALGLTGEHRARFPNGTLAQERLAIRALAFCALGRVADARATALELERLSPLSPHLERLRASCVGN